MDKEEQKRLITEIMNEDAKDGLYEPAQTATEWLFVQLYEKFEMKGDGREMSKVLEQAKKMEEEQSFTADELKAAYYAGYIDAQTNHINDAEEYVNARVYLKNK